MNQNIKKIGLLGGDLRQVRLASLLAGEGYETAVWGFREIMDRADIRQKLEKCVRCADWESALRVSDLVLLPLPVTLDGVRLNCPFSAPESDIRLTEIIEKTGAGCTILGGKIPPLVKRLAAEQGVRTFDYYESEALQIRNAVPTAEGALAIAIQELPIALQGTKALVTGYGRVGRTLAHKLILLGAKVTVAARSGKDLAWAESEGCSPVRLPAYQKEPVSADIIFNTIPAPVFSEEVLARLNPSVLYVELASGSGGIDPKAESGIRVIEAQGLPGKLSPYTAGEIIFDAVQEYLEDGETVSWRQE